MKYEISKYLYLPYKCMFELLSFVLFKNIDSTMMHTNWSHFGPVNQMLKAFFITNANIYSLK